MKNLSFFLFSFLLFSIPLFMQAQESSSKPKLIYIFDPLCGWCYGFSPVMQSLQDQYQGVFDFEVVAGGMMTGDNVRTAAEMANFLKGAYPNVEKRTGVTFGEDFLEGTLNSPNRRFNSMPACQALALFKQEKPEQALNYAHALQKAIYQEGIDCEDEQALAAVAASFGLEAQAFAQKLGTPEAEELAKQDFARAAYFGAKGFPTLLFEKDGEYFLLSNGYIDAEPLQNWLEKQR